VRTIAALAARGIPVGVMVGPIIPGLNDQDIPPVLSAAREAGARSASFVLLRLPGSCKEVFVDRLRAAAPLQADRVLHRIRETRDGKLYDARFGVRGRGQGHYSDAIATLFHATARRLGFEVGGPHRDRLNFP
jgi:DNA repair photolyase